MAVTVTSPTLDVDYPIARLAAVANQSMFWDKTEKRYKSGILVTTISDINWTGTEVADEVATVTVQPPNYNPACHNKSYYQPDVNNDTWNDGMSIVLVTAINYGWPGPSARMEQDGTITLNEALIELPPGTESSVVATMTYNNVFTEYSPYSTLSGGSSKSATMSIAAESEDAWGMISEDESAGSEGAVIIQLTSLVTSVLEGFPPGGTPPSFELQNSPQLTGGTLASVEFVLPNTVGRTNVFENNYTYLFALNDGKVDANGRPIHLPSQAKILYSLCNFGITKPFGVNSMSVTGVLTYLKKLVTI